MAPAGARASRYKRAARSAAAYPSLSAQRLSSRK